MAKYTKRKDGRYCTSVSIGYDNDGKPIKKYLYAKTTRELDLKKAQYITAPIKAVNKNIQLADYSKRWIENFKNNITPGTLKLYRTALDKYILPTYGAKTLSAITKADIQALINENFNSFAICHKIKITFKQILDLAMDESLIQRNVCYNIKMPQKNKPNKRALTKAEVDAIFNADLNDMERLFVEILYYFGVRRGEALALTGADFKNGYLTINKNLTTVDGVGVISTPKTQNSYRQIPIPKQFTPPKTKERLFRNDKNELLFDARFRYFWKHIKKKIEDYLGYETDMTCHTFRHNYCTLCYYQFSLLQTKELMGHADEKMIMEVYAHLDHEKESLKEKISNLF